MAIDKIVAEYRLELDGLRKDFDAVKDQVKSVEETISKSNLYSATILSITGNNFSPISTLVFSISALSCACLSAVVKIVSPACPILSSMILPTAFAKSPVSDVPLVREEPREPVVAGLTGSWAQLASCG